MFNIVFYNSNGGRLDKFDFSTIRNCSGLCYNNANIKRDLTMDLPNAVVGNFTFAGCSQMTSFTGSLPVLKNGYSMFTNCSKMVSFNASLDELESGVYMFQNASTMATFKTTSLENLNNGNYMFQNCKVLKEFVYDMPKLINAEYMFAGCLELENIITSLDSLEYGAAMFQQCKLSPLSVFYIIKSLPTYTSNHNLTLGINVANDEDVAANLETFAQDAFFESWADLKAAFSAKKWNTTFQYAGTSTKITLSEDEQFRGIPIYAKLIENVDPEIAEYCTEDGEQYFNLDWGHDVVDPSEYQYFGSLLEACGYYGIIPKKYLEEI